MTTQSPTQENKAIITVGQVKQHEYCPLIPWLQENLVYNPPPTPSMELGKAEENLDLIADKLGLPHPRYYNKCLHDPTTGLKGCPDIIAGEKWRIVVEVKKFNRPIHQSRHFLMQTKAYAVLVNNTLGKVRYYILVLGDQVIEKPLTPQDIEEVTRQINNLQAASYRPLLNTEPDPRKCSYCDYRVLCPLNASRTRSSLVIT